MSSVDDRVAAWRREFPEIEPLVLQLVSQARQLAAVLDALDEQVLEPFEISLGEFELLSALRCSGVPYRATPSSLAGQLRCSSGGVTKRVKKLESGGYVGRSADPEDGRGTLVFLSQRGLDLQERIFRTFSAAAESRLGSIDERRARSIVDALRSLTEALEA
jgi:DNA-binding MarR family transcriptional regulator